MNVGELDDTEAAKGFGQHLETNAMVGDLESAAHTLQGAVSFVFAERILLDTSAAPARGDAVNRISQAWPSAAIVGAALLHHVADLSIDRNNPNRRRQFNGSTRVSCAAWRPIFQNQGWQRVLLRGTL